MPRKRNLSICSVAGCDLSARSLGMCRKHYMRQYLYGRTNLKHSGKKRGHPLYAMWWERKRQNLLCERWAEFEHFATDLGVRPSGDHFLVRPDGSRPFGPDNFDWRLNLRRQPGESKKDWWARKWSARQTANPGLERRRGLRRRYGITESDYDRLLLEHDNKCAICKEAETAIDGKTGTIRKLAVDHCHQTGSVRGLLCFRCNAMLGRVKESITILAAMQAYLSKHNQE